MINKFFKYQYVVAKYIDRQNFKKFVNLSFLLLEKNNNILRDIK